MTIGICIINETDNLHSAEVYYMTPVNLWGILPIWWWAEPPQINRQRGHKERTCWRSRQRDSPEEKNWIL